MARTCIAGEPLEAGDVCHVTVRCAETRCRASPEGDEAIETKQLEPRQADEEGRLKSEGR